MPRIKALKEPTGGKDHLVQFRVDDSFMKRLLVVSERKKTPIGVLARQWVAERLTEEIRQVQGEITRWVELRQSHIQKMIDRELEHGAILTIHVTPVSAGSEIGAAELEELRNMFSRMNESKFQSFGINMDGFIERTRIEGSSKLVSYMQVFSSGQIEGVQVLPETRDKVLSAGDITEILTGKVIIFCRILELLKVPPPVEVFIGFSQMHGYQFDSQSTRGVGDKFTSNDFAFPSTLIIDWKQVESKESTEEILGQAIRRIWNAAGLSDKPQKSKGIEDGATIKKASIDRYLKELKEREKQQQHAEWLAQRAMTEAPDGFASVCQFLSRLSEGNKAFGFLVTRDGTDICNVRSTKDQRRLQVSIRGRVIRASFEGGRGKLVEEFTATAVLVSSHNKSSQFVWIGSESEQFTNQELAESLLVMLAKLQVL